MSKLAPTTCAYQSSYHFFTRVNLSALVYTMLWVVSGSFLTFFVVCTSKATKKCSFWKSHHQEESRKAFLLFGKTAGFDSVLKSVLEELGKTGKWGNRATQRRFPTMAATPRATVAGLKKALSKRWDKTQSWVHRRDREFVLIRPPPHFPFTLT